MGRRLVFDFQLLNFAQFILDAGSVANVKARVLVIEDDKDIADLISLYLNRDGIETLYCEDGETGLSAVSDYRPDLVVLDINLPGMD
ncbi:MAG: response regulator, partial [Spirochaetaceae bacterium]|nr:response regulator [Spirochaetaceae bacterium]